MRNDGRMAIGILTSGGDCPGLNAVIRGAVLKGDKIYNQEFVGFKDGWRGVVGHSARARRASDGDCTHAARPASG